MSKTQRVVMMNQKGMGVLEVTIAAAIGVMVVAGIYSAMDVINRSVIASQVRLDAVTVQDELRLIFSRPENCLATFADKKFMYTGGGGLLGSRPRLSLRTPLIAREQLE